ncbi:histidinol-phosphatase [Glaciecola sp. MH2013]|uniref:tyrosine-protein phosphatase n=1 Tax=Glaciecola sp. MH2013 TaxID=2785524 RepID=UPI00189FF3D9|nr:CpsB/CapC family capsule biosynthesis tyrosine phosphatase [Glaciecola sp. MH2013]MBF7074883.1 histidinol-phosphatase [Glaciecola sp. MH2013]
MIDLHSHILAGIDDGAKSLSESIAMAQQSLESGVSYMVCTPHIHQGVFNNKLETIKPVFDVLVAEMKKISLPLKLAYSCEVRLCPEVLQWVTDIQLPYLGQWDRKALLLLELPHSHVPPGAENLIKWLLKNRIQPVIPHPERNRDIIADYRKAEFLKKLGCLFQITAGAFTGRFSDKVAATAHRLLKDGYIDYIASDMHSLNRRPNDMGEAFKVIEKTEGKGTAMKLTTDVPALITKNTRWFSE